MNPPTRMISRSRWAEVRDKFTQEERDALNAANVGTAHICRSPRSESGWVNIVDLSKLTSELVTKLDEELTHRCQTDGCRDESVALCDEPAAGGGTCDRRMCPKHRARVGRNRDRCGLHAPRKVQP